MGTRSTRHATFVIELSYAALPAQVFAAWAAAAAKARWFALPYEFDFRVGGREFSRGGPAGGSVYIFDARYQDIVPNERIVYTYDMYMDRRRISVSLVTVELEPQGAGTRLIFSEQAVFLDGHDLPALRERGTRDSLLALGAELRRDLVQA